MKIVFIFLFIILFISCNTVPDIKPQPDELIYKVLVSGGVVNFIYINSKDEDKIINMFKKMKKEIEE